jgi:hypothetical protein
MAKRVVNERFTGYGAIQPGAHPEFDTPVAKPKSPFGLGVALSNSFRAVKRGLGLESPDYSGIDAEIAEKKSINRYLQSRGGKI